MEQFSPLVKIDFEMKNSVKVTAEIKKDRSLSLSFDNNLLTEIHGNEYIFGLGYRIKDLKINRIAVDEAHCISEWGNDFRPAFKQIKNLRKLLPDTPILAVTATATTKVLEDIISSLELEKTCLFQESFVRSNISINTLFTEDKFGTLIKLLSGNKKSGIVYCGSRKMTEQVAKILQHNELSSAYFHGGRTASERKELLHEWLNEKTKIMVATNAFGMGVDKSEVATVIHLNLPSSIENFFQEVGRAGRNGAPAKTFLLLQQNDKNRIRDQFLGTLPDKGFIKVLSYRLG